MSDTQIDAIIPVKLTSLNDIARLASSTSALGHVTYILHFARGGKHYYGILVVFRDYYKFYGLPMFYYIVSDKELPGNYILFKAEETGEIVEVAKGTKPGFITLPIVNIEPDSQLLRKIITQLD
ncbi:MAG: cren protein [Infirmifilum sp.]